MSSVHPSTYTKLYAFVILQNYNEVDVVANIIHVCVSLYVFFWSINSQYGESKRAVHSANGSIYLQLQ